MASVRAADIKDSFFVAVEKISDYAVFLTDAEGMITYWNPAAVQMKGYRAEEAVGRHIGMLYSADARLRGDPERNLRRAATEGTLQEQSLRVTKDGHSFWAMTELIAIRDGQGILTGFCKITRDITAFRDLQAQLQREKQRVEVALEAIGDAVISTDTAGNVGFVNRKAEQITGWTASSAHGKGIEEVLHVVDGSRQRANETELMHDKSELEGAAIAIVEDPGGIRRVIENITTPVCLPDGEKLGEVMVFRDVTQRQTDVRLMREAERNKDEFLATLAHELRNPLTPILTAARLLRTGAPDADRAHRMVEVIDRQAQHLLGLVDDLLDVSRIAQGKVSLDIAPHLIAPLVASAVEQIQAMLDQKGHTLELRMGAAPLSVMCDRNRMVQVISNLLGNAVRYTGDGGHIVVEARSSGGLVILEVSDDGIGMSSEMLPRVFELFVQEKRGGDQGRTGLGIGLALVKNLVELQGGQVRCYSEGIGQGSRFTLELPRSP